MQCLSEVLWDAESKKKWNLSRARACSLAFRFVTCTNVHFQKLGWNCIFVYPASRKLFRPTVHQPLLKCSSFGFVDTKYEQPLHRTTLKLFCAGHAISACPAGILNRVPVVKMWMTFYYSISTASKDKMPKLTLLLYLQPSLHSEYASSPGMAFYSQHTNARSNVQNVTIWSELHSKVNFHPHIVHRVNIFYMLKHMCNTRANQAVYIMNNSVMAISFVIYPRLVYNIYVTSGMW